MRILRLTTALFLFWMALSASLDPLGSLLGLAVSLAVASLTVRAVWDDEGFTAPSLGLVWRLLLYLPYLTKEIVKASVLVAEKVLDPRLPIDPVVIEYRSRLRERASRVALANSITLTPGTLTVDLEDGTLRVHCLGREFAETLTSGELEHRVARVFEGA